jgi:hypothetical protein
MNLVNTSQLNPHNSFPWWLRVLDSRFLSYNCLTHHSSESYVTNDSQSASLSWNKAPTWGLQPDFYYCQTVAGLLMWGALSGERTGVSFTIAADPHQRSHSQVEVPWKMRPYFTVSDSRLPFLFPPMTHWAMVGVFNPALCFITLKEPNRDHCLQGIHSAYSSFKKSLPWICLQPFDQNHSNTMFSMLLPSNGRLFLLDYPSFQPPRHIIKKIVAPDGIQS